MTAPTPPNYPPPPPSGPVYPPPSTTPAGGYPPPQYPPPAYTPPAGYYQPPAAGTQMPNQNWALSIIGILFFLFTGIAAVYFSSQVKTLWSRGDAPGAERASRNAKTWGIVSIVLGVLVIIAYASTGSSTT